MNFALSQIEWLMPVARVTDSLETSRTPGRCCRTWSSIASLGRQQASSVYSYRIIPWQKPIDPALLVSVHDGSECGAQVGQRIDGIELAGLDQRGDDRQVLRSCVMPCEECAFFRLRAIGRMVRSTLLLSISMRPSVRKSFSPSQYLAM